jgi:hypothetical protein
MCKAWTHCELPAQIGEQHFLQSRTGLVMQDPHMCPELGGSGRVGEQATLLLGVLPLQVPRRTVGRLELVVPMLQVHMPNTC